MTPEYLHLLLDYHYWARDRMLDAIGALSVEQYERDMGNSFASVRDTANHLFHAEWIWHARWIGETPTAAARPGVADRDALRSLWTIQESRIRSFVASLGTNGIDRVFEYRTLAGVEMRSKFWEMLVHVVNHGTYHRGQIVTMMRQLGCPPPVATDMIAYFRLRSA
jgi:uncharacterized damage-inducible protein DinB